MPRPGTTPDDPADRELLERLAAAFHTEEVEPDGASLQHLAAAVAARWAPPPTPPPAPSPSPSPSPHHIHWPRRLSPLAIAGAVAGTLVIGSGISYAVGGPALAPVRSVVRSVGLAPSPSPPTTTPSPPSTTLPPVVSAARQAESALRQALATKNVPPAVISRDSSDLARRLAQVGADRGPEAGGISTDGRQLLLQACHQLYGQAPTGNSTTVTQPGTPTGSACPSTTTSAPSNPTHPSYPGHPTNSTSTVPSTATRSTTPRPTHHRSGGGSTPYGGSPRSPSSTSTTSTAHSQQSTTTTSSNEPRDEPSTTTTTSREG
jgi:hypothetical protein